MLESKPVIYIIGSSGHAHVLKSMIADGDCFSFSGFIEKDNENRASDDLILYESQFLASQKNQKINLLLGIGDRSRRVADIMEKFLANNANFPSLIHHTSAIDKTAIIGTGSVCLPLSSVKANSSIGAFSIINNNSVVGHDSEISQFVHLSLGAVICGNAKIGEHTLIGANATVLPGITIGKNCIIGAGSIVTKNVPDNEIWSGNPAKKSKKLS